MKESIILLLVVVSTCSDVCSGDSRANNLQQDHSTNHDGATHPGSGNVLLTGRSDVDCRTDLDCQLSGICDLSSNTCKCDPEWSGPHCSLLNLKPNLPGHFAYRPKAVTTGSTSIPSSPSSLSPSSPTGPYWNSWGSSPPIYDNNTSLFHLYSTRILNDCPVSDYTYNEDLVHATSQTLLGPYDFQNVALNTTIINPHVVAAPDGKLVLFYSGEPLPSHYHKNCSGGAVAEPPGPPGYVNIGCVLSIATSSNFAEPFEVKLANFTPAGAEELFCRTNPTAFIYDNGTTLLFFRSAESSGQNEQIWLATAPHYLGPYALFGGSPIFPNSNEDPFVFRNSHGHFILMLHRSHWGPGWNGAKAYSKDGMEWHYTDESMNYVWNSTINYTDGSDVTFQRREEPKIYVSQEGRMLAMFNAVVDVRTSSSGSYVMSQAIGSDL